MTLLARTATLALLVAAPLFSMAQKDAKALQKMYMDYLSEEGYRPEVDGDGDVQFKAEGRTYFIDVTEDDQEYFRVALANIWPIESEKEREQCYIACDFSNAQTKVAKAYLVKDNIWVGIEIFVAEPGDFKAVFKRSMSALNSGVDNFVKKMKEE
ncbi:MAG TPA: hypothetical protein PK760_14060 [Flavobacteriales bacterium]|nr:hypothetical protein [Flavobacteriales bacterium]